MVSVTGQGINAAFTYDGDGKRVKSVINGTTTYFVGNLYEVSELIVTKYYYAGASRVAMPVGGFKMEGEEVILLGGVVEHTGP